ncbi:MAG: hypothetical protein FE041_04135, partial [Thermoplasmata archaeon]
MNAKRMNIILLALVGLLITSFLILKMEIVNSVAQGAGDILYVGGSSPSNYTSIQSAINDANDGDTIFVYSGVYYENVVINKSITLIGENKETTIIDGSNSGDVVNITANGVTIEGFTIRNSRWHAGIKICYANNVNI